MGAANNIISILAINVMWILVLLVYNYFIQKPLDSKWLWELENCSALAEHALTCHSQLFYL